MMLSPDQQDALIEICNVGMSKAAKQLSTLLSSHIDITIPNISLSDVDDVKKTFNPNGNQIFVYVYQHLTSGAIGDSALLVFNRQNTELLTQSVIGEAPKMTENEVRACEQEAMLEIGNIIISCCVSSIADMLSRKIELTTPNYGEDQINNLLNDQLKEIGASSKNAIIISTKLETQAEDVSGSLVLVMPKDSIEKLLDSLQRLLGT